MSVSRIALPVMSERRLPRARPASLLIGDGNHLVQQSGVFRAAKHTQALLKNAAAGCGSHDGLFASLGQFRKGSFDEFLDRGNLAGPDGVADRLLPAPGLA